MSSASYATQRKKALHYIREFLKEEQLFNTLEALEVECINDFEDSDTVHVNVPINGLQFAVDLFEDMMASNSTLENREQENHVTNLLKSDLDLPAPKTCVNSLDNLHPLNVLSLITMKEFPSLSITTSACRDIVISNIYTGETICKLSDELNGACLSTDYKVVYDNEGKVTLYVLGGLMSGEVLIAKATGLDYYLNKDQVSEEVKDNENPNNVQFQIIYNAKPHQKFVVGVKFSPNPIIDGYISISHDEHVAVVKTEGEEVQSNVPVYSDVDQLGLRVTLLQKCKGQVESIALIRPETESPEDDIKFVIGVRNDHLLHIVNFTTSRLVHNESINLNYLGDDYVSLVPLALDCKKGFILVSTDKHRVILIDIAHKKQVRNYYKCFNDGFASPRVLLNDDIKTFHITSQFNEVYTYNTNDCSIIYSEKCHTKSIKGMGYKYKDGLVVGIITTGFDKSLKQWTF